jgi:dihydroneopterin aldolase
LAIAASDISASWDITSDALAAWLAGKLGADGLLLVKQSREFSQGDDVAGLTDRGIVDPAVDAMLPTGIEFRLAGPRDAASAAAILSEGRLPGIRIETELEGVA